MNRNQYFGVAVPQKLLSPACLLDNRGNMPRTLVFPHQRISLVKNVQQTMEYRVGRNSAALHLEWHMTNKNIIQYLAFILKRLLVLG